MENGEPWAISIEESFRNDPLNTPGWISRTDFGIDTDSSVARESRSMPPLRIDSIPSDSTMRRTLRIRSM